MIVAIFRGPAISNVCRTIQHFIPEILTYQIQQSKLTLKILLTTIVVDSLFSCCNSGPQWYLWFFIGKSKGLLLASCSYHYWEFGQLKNAIQHESSPHKIIIHLENSLEISLFCKCIALIKILLPFQLGL